MGKPSNRDASDDGKQVWDELENITRFGYGNSTIFSDWIDCALNSLLSLTANIGKADLIERVKTNGFDDEYNARYMAVGRDEVATTFMVEHIKRLQTDIAQLKQKGDEAANSPWAQYWSRPLDIILAQTWMEPWLAENAAA